MNLGFLLQKQKDFDYTSIDEHNAEEFFMQKGYGQIRFMDNPSEAVKWIALERVAENLLYLEIDYELVLKVFKYHATRDHACLLAKVAKNLDKKYVTQEIHLILLDIRLEYFNNIPQENKTEEIINLAIKNDMKQMRELRTPQEYPYFFPPSVLMSIDIKDSELIKEIIDLFPMYLVYDKPLKSITQEHILYTFNMCKKDTKDKKLNEMYKEFIRDLIDYYPELVPYDIYLWLIKEADSILLLDIPQEFKTQEVIEAVLDTSIYTHIKYIKQPPKKYIVKMLIINPYFMEVFNRNGTVVEKELIEKAHTEFQKLNKTNEEKEDLKERVKSILKFLDQIDFKCNS